MRVRGRSPSAGSAWSLSRLAWVALLWLPAAVHSQEKSFDLAGVPFLLQDSTDQVDVYYKSVRFDYADEVWKVDVVVSNRSPESLPGPLVLLVDDFTGTTGPLEPDGVDDSSPAKAYYDLTVVLEAV